MNSAAFNQDATSLVVASHTGYAVYNCQPFAKLVSVPGHATGKAEMLFSTSLLALVGSGEEPNASPRRLRMVNTKRETTICELTLPTKILNVRLNRHRMAVILEDQIFLYNIANMKLLHAMETSPNPHGVADLSPGSESDAGVLAYSSGPPSKHTLVADTKSSPSGEITFLDLNNFAPLNVIKAHKAPLAVLKLAHDGSLLATASDKGTIVRVYSVPAGSLLHEFRRGSYPCRIHSLAFNMAGSLLAVSSSTSTVHIYRLNGEPPQPVESSQESGKPSKGYAASWRKKVDKALAAADVWDQTARDYAWFKIPANIHSVIALSPDNILYLATKEGFAHYAVGDKGGECKKLGSYSFS